MSVRLDLLHWYQIASQIGKYKYYSAGTTAAKFSYENKKETRFRNNSISKHDLRVSVA